MKKACLQFNTNVFVATLKMKKKVRRGHARMAVESTTTYESVPFATNVVSWNPTQSMVTRCNVIKFVSDLRQVGDFLRALRFPPTKQLTTPMLLKY